VHFVILTDFVVLEIAQQRGSMNQSMFNCSVGAIFLFNIL